MKETMLNFQDKKYTMLTLQGEFILQLNPTFNNQATKDIVAQDLKMLGLMVCNDSG